MTDSEKLDQILVQMQGVKEDVHILKADAQGLKTDMQGLKADAQMMQTDMQGLKEDVQDMQTNVHVLKADVLNLQKDVRILQKKTDILEIKVTKVEITTENEISVNIQRVAEGHLDLSRNLHECVRLASDIKSKQEIQDIFIVAHDNKLKAMEDFYLNKGIKAVK